MRAMRVNVQTFCTLLRAFETKASILPTLRQYSLWLVLESSILSCQMKDDALNQDIRLLSQAYVQLLNQFYASCKDGEMHRTEYLLPEDEEARAFRPLYNLQHERACHRYVDNGNKPKPSLRSKQITRDDAAKEDLSRQLDILGDGVYLCSRPVRV